ncbi:MAG: hypothetical protein R2911_10645 [Caldilineaceae bacterium]
MSKKSAKSKKEAHEPTTAENAPQPVPDASADDVNVEEAAADATIAPVASAEEETEASAADAVEVRAHAEEVSDTDHHAAARHTNGQNGVSQNGNGHHSNGHNGDGQNGAASNGKAKNSRKAAEVRTLQIIFQRTGNLDRDKFRLREIRDMIANPRPRSIPDHPRQQRRQRQTGLPNDYCTISDRLVNELTRLKVEVSVEPE